MEKDTMFQGSIDKVVFGIVILLIVSVIVLRVVQGPAQIPAPFNVLTSGAARINNQKTDDLNVIGVAVNTNYAPLVSTPAAKKPTITFNGVDYPDFTMPRVDSPTLTLNPAHGAIIPYTSSALSIVANGILGNSSYAELNLTGVQPGQTILLAGGYDTNGINALYAYPYTGLNVKPISTPSTNVTGLKTVQIRIINVGPSPMINASVVAKPSSETLLTIPVLAVGAKTAYYTAADISSLDLQWYSSSAPDATATTYTIEDFGRTYATLSGTILVSGSYARFLNEALIDPLFEVRTGN